MNEQTIKASYRIDEILSKLWVDGDIGSDQKQSIMQIVNQELNFEFK